MTSLENKRMKSHLIVSSLLLVGSIADARAEERKQLQVESRRLVEPWALDDQSRVSARIREARASHPKLAPSTHAAGSSLGTSFRPTYTVEGSRHPEMFMPWELMNRLLRGLDPNPEYRSGFRETLRQDIRARGWDDEKFWKDLEGLATTYKRLAIEGQELDRRIDTAAPPSRRELERQGAALSRTLCAARSSALRAARQHFGRVEFDRFLYTAIAPTLTISFAGSIEDETERLLYIERGCQ